MPLVFLGGQHADELTAAVVEFTKIANFLGFQGSHLGGSDFGEGDDGGVDGVGLGQIVHGLGENRGPGVR